MIVSEVNSNQAVYLSAKRLFESIEQLIPEALNRVQKTVDEYKPHNQFIAINVFSRKRIAITVEGLRSVG